MSPLFQPAFAPCHRPTKHYEDDLASAIELGLQGELIIDPTKMLWVTYKVKDVVVESTENELITTVIL